MHLTKCLNLFFFIKQTGDHMIELENVLNDIIIY